jgi:kinesin family protein 11
MEGELTSSVSEHSGVIPRAIHTIFDQLNEGRYEDYSVKVSFLELYNEELADLLAEQEERSSSSSMSMGASKGDDSEKKELRIFEDATGKKGMLVHNLEEVLVTGSAQVFQLLQKANKNRKVAETNLNARSSRSHYVFTITVHTKEYNEDGEDVIKTGKLYLVDLAGSECIGKSGATEKRAKEAGKINQSLLTLGRVINALVDRSSFIPYRDSKLTRLLQESLGGRAKTVIIATVSPSYAAFDETLSTLDYAHRAKSIKNKPQVNQKMTKVSRCDRLKLRRTTVAAVE